MKVIERNYFFVLKRLHYRFFIKNEILKSPVVCDLLYLKKRYFSPWKNLSPQKFFKIFLPMKHLRYELVVKKMGNTEFDCDKNAINMSLADILK